ncbi:MAG: hypothetical protein DWQ05_14580 [Calditrichaeota bacterium]|nr:MAG: hypothetical protein DWQ05_14580 [Calditrichota bacterium]
MPSSNLTLKTIFKFWLPLFLTWLMMAFEGPFLTAIIARMASSTYNLAAYGVAFSFALIIEAPVIMIMTASTALIKDNLSFCRLRNFTYALNIIITASMLIILIPDIFNYLTITLIGLEKNVAHLTHITTLILLPWPGAIGYRRFYQGILIRSHQTRKVAYGTAVRVISMFFTALILYLFSQISGAYIGAIALSTGVILEAVAARIMAHKATNNIRNKQLTAGTTHLSYRGISLFYYPLALTSFLGLGIHPLVTFFIGQSKNSLESLAILPVVNAIVFVFRAFGLSFQEVAVTYLGSGRENRMAVNKFAALLALAASAGLFIIAMPPFFTLWYTKISGLSPELAQFARIPTLVLILLPGFSVWLSWQRSVLVAGQFTKPITFATAIEVCGIAAVIFILIQYFDFIGATAAACAFLIGRFAANVYLIKPVSKLQQR